MLNEYEQTLLDGWEDVHRRSQLTLWILLAIKHSPKQMQDIKDFIESRTNKQVTADDKSIYRALRRLNEADMIKSESIKSEAGPNAKVFELTKIGNKVLSRFLKNNVNDIFLAKVNIDILEL